MAEIEFRFPSVIPYAYVNWRGTEEEAANLNPEMLATLYANVLSSFQKAEAEAAKTIVQGRKAKPDRLTEGLAEVFAKPLPAELKNLGPQPLTAVLNEMREESEVKEESAAQEIREALGATEIQDVNEPPWKKPQKPSGPEPWETDKPKATVTLDLEDW